MEKGDEFYQTRDTRLVAALTAVGIGLSDVLPFGKFIDAKTGKTQIVWHLNTISNCKRYSTNKLVAAYHDPFLMKKDDPEIADFAHAVAALKNREQLIDIINAKEGIIEEYRNDELWLIPEHKKNILDNL